MKRKTLPLVKSCDDCGACCTGQCALPIHLVNEHAGIEPVSPLPPELADELRETVARFQRDGWPDDGSPCIWYDAEKRQCKHYEHRPELCRDEVKVGDTACLKWRKAVGIDPNPKYRIVRGKIVRS